MVKKRKVHFFNDFTGGLNLDAPRQSLAMNETFDCMDVDFNVRGGFAQRLGLLVRTEDANMNDGYLLGQFNLGTDFVVGVSASSRLWTWDGSTATHVATAITDSTETVRAVSWNSKFYLVNCWSAGNLVARYRSSADLSTVTALTNTFNDNYTAPNGGDMPLARLITDHCGHMFVADTSESGTRYRYRLRYSHPLQPEDWATEDYIDFEPDDQSDQITALVPFKDHLLVFKRRSVHALYGGDKDSFYPQPLVRGSGVWSQEAVAVNAGVCYWWSPDGNVYAYNGTGVVPIGDRIHGAFRDGDIQAGADHRVTWAEERLWLSLVTPGGTRLCFVYDPNVGKRGAFTRYSYQPTSVVWWRSAAGENQVLMTLKDTNGVFDATVPTQFADELTSGVQTPIDGYYTTAWFSADDTALKKSFKRMHITAAALDPCDIYIDVYMDFNDSAITRTLITSIETGSSEAMEWGTGEWGTAVWGGGDASYIFDRMTSAGRGHAIKFKFRTVDNTTTWWVDSFTIPYDEKGYR
jgi:hypothetical protein